MKPKRKAVKGCKHEYELVSKKEVESTWSSTAQSTVVNVPYIEVVLFCKRCGLLKKTSL